MLNMLYNESLWFRDAIRNYIKPGTLILNIGSSSKDFIDNEQPYIRAHVFNELERLGCQIKNVDLRNAKGVDLVGDVTNASFINKLRAMQPGAVICSNLLEHLKSREPFTKGLINIMNPNTILLVSVPYEFPYHEDPIDTMYRPDPVRLLQDLGNVKMLEGKIVPCGTYFSFSTMHASSFRKFMVWLKLALLYFPTWLLRPSKLDTLKWNFRNISATCCVFRKA
jgi:hypothetical protein